jgi:truncated hemoglobin YjbI
LAVDRNRGRTTVAQTIYERIGGRTAVRRAVDEFYRRMTADAAFAPLFRDVDMDALHGHQVAVLSLLAGGPNRTLCPDLPSLRDLLVRAHGRLGVSDSDFDRMAGHLVASLRQLSVDEGDIETLAKGLEEFREHIVSATASGDEWAPDPPHTP